MRVNAPTSRAPHDRRLNSGGAHGSVFDSRSGWICSVHRGARNSVDPGLSVSCASGAVGSQGVRRPRSRGADRISGTKGLNRDERQASDARHGAAGLPPRTQVRSQSSGGTAALAPTVRRRRRTVQGVSAIANSPSGVMPPAADRSRSASHANSRPSHAQG